MASESNRCRPALPQAGGLPHGLPPLPKHVPGHGIAALVGYEPTEIMREFVIAGRECAPEVHAETARVPIVRAESRRGGAPGPGMSHAPMTARAGSPQRIVPRGGGCDRPCVTRTRDDAG